jgi:Protein of unknown function (DUF998)
MKSISSKIAAWISIATIILYHTLMFALFFIRPDLDPYWHTISEWAIGPYGWIMVFAFLCSATSYGALFLAIKSQLIGLTGRIGVVLLFICCIGTVMVGVFVTDPMPEVGGPHHANIQLTTTGTLHMIGGSTALFLLPFAALLINLSLAIKNQKWVSAKPVLLITGFIPLLGLIGFVIHMMIYIVPLGDYAYGPDVPLGWPSRILLLLYMIWVVTLAVQQLRQLRGKSNWDAKEKSESNVQEETVGIKKKLSTLT